MGVFDKLKFWKRDDEFGAPVNDTSSYDLGSQSNALQNDPMRNPDSFQPDTSHHDRFSSPNEETDQYGQYPQGSANYPQPVPFPGQQRSTPEYQQEHTTSPAIQQRDVELILAKLDGLKSELDALHQRIRKIEQYTDQHTDQQTPIQKKYW